MKRYRYGRGRRENSWSQEKFSHVDVNLRAHLKARVMREKAEEDVDEGKHDELRRR